MGSLSQIFKGRWTIWILALFFSLFAGFGVLTILGQAADRVPYYVLAQDIDARVQITPDIVMEKTAPADSVPVNALSYAEITSGQLFSIVPLSAGSVLQESVVGDLKPLTSGLPNGYVLASVAVAPENAVGGRIKRGDYIDVAAVQGTDISTATSKIILQHVLVVDVTVAPSSIAQSANSSSASTTSSVTGGTTSGSTTNKTPGVDSPQLYGGIPQLYTLAVSPTEFAKLALARTANLYLALSAAQTPDSLSVSQNGSALFAAGSVTPSYPVKGSSSTGSTGSTTGSATDTKSVVEALYTKYVGKSGFKVTVEGDYLQVINTTTKEVIDAVPLAGGTFDVTTGKYTAATN